MQIESFEHDVVESKLLGSSVWVVDGAGKRRRFTLGEKITGTLMEAMAKAEERLRESVKRIAEGGHE